MFSQVVGNKKAFQRLTTRFNGVILDERLSNHQVHFKTIKVTGRESLDEEHVEQKIPGRNGSYFLNSTQKTKVIEVECLMEGADRGVLTRTFRQLHAILATATPSKLSFSDDEGFYFLAKYQSIGNPEIKRDATVFSIVFICYTPYKYSEEKNGVGESLLYNGDLISMPVVRLQLSSAGRELRVLHVQQQKYIRLLGDFRVGQTVEIDMQAKKITVNGRSALEGLDIVNSRFFGLTKGANKITCNVANRVEIRYREVLRC